MKDSKITKIALLHFIKLGYRSALFIAALICYIVCKIHNTGTLFFGYENDMVLLGIIWGVFFVEMLLRFFPSKYESMGCQKQFKKNYIPTNKPFTQPDTFKTTFMVASVWLILNGIIGIMYYFGWFDVGVLLLISLFYSVCDIICILFFCPFQVWFMKNKCCTTCRIYNWDYAMMFTPLLLIKNTFSQTLVAMALLLLIKWEYTFRKYPQRFFETTNTSLSCANCKEKLCKLKNRR